MSYQKPVGAGPRACPGPIPAHFYGLQPFIIHGKTLDDVFAQSLDGPDSFFLQTHFQPYLFVLGLVKEEFGGSSLFCDLLLIMQFAPLYQAAG